LISLSLFFKENLLWFEGWIIWMRNEVLMRMWMIWGGGGGGKKKIQMFLFYNGMLK
jgi:hypothetical protein